MSYITVLTKEWRFDVYDTATTTTYWSDIDYDSNDPHACKACINDNENDILLKKIMEPLYDHNKVYDFQEFSSCKTKICEDYKKVAERCIELKVDPLKIFRGSKYGNFLEYWLYNYRTDLLPDIIKLIDDNKLV